MQNEFYEGKERCHGLIEELQSASNAKDAEHRWIPDYQREVFAEKQEAVADSVIDGVIGDVVFGTLVYLFSELQREQEVARVDSLRLVAENGRAQREAAERDTRRAEWALRQKEDEQFRRVVQAADGTVETYMEQLFSSTAHSVAATQALREGHVAKQRAAAERARTPRDTLSDSGRRLQDEEVVCGLLESFVIPEVCKGRGGGPGEAALAAAALSVGCDVFGSL